LQQHQLFTFIRFIFRFFFSSSIVQNNVGLAGIIPANHSTLIQADQYQPIASNLFKDVNGEFETIIILLFF